MSKMVGNGLEFPVKHYLLWSLFLCLSYALDTLKPGDFLHNNQTLVSSGLMFELGFFTSGETGKNYLGIWYKKDESKKPVWVATRDYPLLGSSGFLIVRRTDGNLVMSDSRLQPIIVNTGSSAASGNTSATLLDSGNLILRQGEITVWQSFDYPTDTFLPGMKLGLFDMNTNDIRRVFLLSWSGPSVPASGSFAVGVNDANKSQFNLYYKNLSKEIGFWDGKSFRFIFESSSDKNNFRYVSNAREIYLTFDNSDNTIASWFELTPTGEINEYAMTEQGITIVNHSLCGGVSEFNPMNCLTVLPLNCKDGNKFSELTGSMPISMVRTWSTGLSLSDCELVCRSNCSCTAFASLEDVGIKCQMYYGDRKDLLDIIGEGNTSIYVRGGASSDSGNGQMKKLWWIILVAVISLILMVMTALYYKRRKIPLSPEANRNSGTIKDTAELLTFRSRFDLPSSDDDARTDHELPLLSFSCIATATDNFSSASKIGEGGFGPVYMGKLSGQEIAVKRLSASSGQGLEEFETEVQLISKLQHINLVKLLGYCIEQEEKILIYEYMPNKSLDSFIFDPVKRRLINWRQRKHIIEGIAQGLLYLHKYSRLKIIHRDLKTSNILLDNHMNPKISDFGMARIFSDSESRTKTRRVVGTYGYMSPEYGVHGLFSTKSDVYSFGVILLEIMSGKRNTSFFGSNNTLTLIGHAWELWQAGTCIEFMDPILAADLYSTEELVQCIQIGLLCTQDNAEDRLTMADIVAVLSNEGAALPSPKQPTFSTHLNSVCVDWPSGRNSPSLNFATFSNVEAR